jgi:hypothetical protein
MRSHRWVAAAVAGAALTLCLGLILIDSVQRSTLVQGAVNGGGLMPDAGGGTSLWDKAIDAEPQYLRRQNKVDSHKASYRLVSALCPVGTPGCAKSHQADHSHVLLATHNRNYGYHFLTDMQPASKDVTKDQMVKYVPSPRHQLADQVGGAVEGQSRYRSRLGDEVLDIPNDPGWQAGDVHLAVDGHDRLPFPAMYKVTIM